MKISDVMRRDVRAISPDASLYEAARTMDFDIGVLPVCDGQRLLGVVTERDIMVRATAIGGSPDVTRIDELMSDVVCSCHPGDDVDDVVRRMSPTRLRPIPVVDEENMLVGMVMLSDLCAARTARRR